jgi:succinate-semialdehyde dehydrogenase / glutarate-semialdehyde dehydrogenase
MMISINPATGSMLRTYPVLSPEEARVRLEGTHRAFLGWRHKAVAERVAPLHRLADLLEARTDEWAGLMTAEMGKPISGAHAEVAKCALLCRWYADQAPSLLADDPIDVVPASRCFLTISPLGVILGIMPWNFPFWQVIRFAVPTLAAGNGVLIKHAPGVPGCAVALETLFGEAGFPEQLAVSLLLNQEHVGDLIDHPLVRGVSLTGSTRAGRAVAARAGSALKPTVLELGGSDPYLILADADLDQAVAASLTGRLINSGQSCIAAKRLVVVEEVRSEFEARLEAELRLRRWGDPLDPETEIGPLARADLRDELHRQVTASVAGGARLIMGGRVPARPGFWYPPTLLTGVRPGMPAADEELFGPVVAVLPARDQEQALEIAHATPFGLGAAVFTRNEQLGEHLAAHRLDAGSCFVNDFVRSDPRVPFGGIKDSGWGREMGAYGLRAFTNIKTVWIR